MYKKEAYRIINKIIYLVLCHMRRFINNINPNITIGKNTIIEANVSFHTIYGGKIRIGKNCEIRRGCQFLTYGGDIFIGNNSSVNPYTIVYGQGDIKVGNYVRIAAHCILIPSNHIFSDINIPICMQGLINKGIIIEDDVWIGCGVRILDGVTIEKGCVIGAGSVVTHSTVPYSVYVGIPAKKIKDRK
ncbi:putative acetyltransferase [termite gut metagenome]|uniref:Putative acetyltransferase n=1 Tax=termite gut metagenome TaxID=433724 RepID=A0A5J4S262_9ZZZZ